MQIAQRGKQEITKSTQQASGVNLYRVTQRKRAKAKSRECRLHLQHRGRVILLKDTAAAANQDIPQQVSLAVRMIHHGANCRGSCGMLHSVASKPGECLCWKIFCNARTTS